MQDLFIEQHTQSYNDLKDETNKTYQPLRETYEAAKNFDAFSQRPFVFS
jgi:hypothetical protein